MAQLLGERSILGAESLKVSSPSTEQDDLVPLVERARDGDNSAMEGLIVRYQNRIAGFVYSITGDETTVADLSHNVFVKMIMKLSTLRDSRSFESWLFRIARNICFDHLRHERWRRLFVPFERRHEQVVEPHRGSGRLEVFAKVLGDLPPKQRELIVLLAEKEWTYEELARITRSTVSSVKSRLFRAREQLKRRMNVG